MPGAAIQIELRISRFRERAVDLAPLVPAGCPAGNSACSPLIGQHHLTWMVGAPVEDTISVMHLIRNGIPWCELMILMFG